MPKLSRDEIPVIKLDGAGMSLEISLTPEQRRDLFERPGAEVIGIVRFRSCTYTGHASSEEKDPQVKVRAVMAEMARDKEQEAFLADAQRAMYRNREIEQTLDSVGNGPRDVGSVLDAATAGYPDEDALQAHRERRGSRSHT